MNTESCSASRGYGVARWASGPVGAMLGEADVGSVVVKILALS
jgi:hypothetical protein